MSEKLISFLGYNNTFYYTELCYLLTETKSRECDDTFRKCLKSIVFRFCILSSLNLLQLIILFMGRNSLGGYSFFFCFVVV